MPVGTSARAPARSYDGAVGGYGGEQIEPGGVRALIGRQRQVVAVRQPHDADLDRVHRLSHLLVSTSVFIKRIGDARDQHGRHFILALRRPGFDAGCASRA